MAIQENSSREGGSYRNVVLTLACGLLVVVAVRGLGPAGSGDAHAAPGPPMVPNAAAQRLQMIEELRELRTISGKLGSMERTLESHLTSIEVRLSEQSAAMRELQRRRRKGDDE